jgi:hypothetical protein
MKSRIISIFLILLLPGLQWYTGAVGLSQPGKQPKPEVRLTAQDIIPDGWGPKPKDSPDEKDKRPGHMELVCQSPSIFQLAGKQSAPVKPIYKDYFSPKEEIWVAIPLDNLKGRTGEARIYVIDHNSEELQDGAQLKDVSDSTETLTLPVNPQDKFKLVWANPKTREEGYDVVVDFMNSSNQYGIYEEGVDIVDSGEKGGFYVPEKWVCLESVSFNYHRNAICEDAITIRMNRDTEVRVPEWKRGEEAFPAAYVKNNRIAVNPIFSTSNGISNATLKADAILGNLGDIKAKQIYFSGQMSSSDSYFLVKKNPPDRIQLFYQLWGWYLLNINDGDNDEEIFIGASCNLIYIVLDVPQPPWTIEGKTAPWAEILHYAVGITNDLSQPEAAAEIITHKLYTNVGATYDTSSYYSERNDAFSGFKLTQFYNSIQQQQVGPANCYDMGKALVTFGNILGCNLNLRFCKPFGYLNCVKPVGSVWNSETYFSNHAFASIGDNIFDASLKADSRGNPAKEPYRETWMINIPWFEYKELVARDVLQILGMKVYENRMNINAVDEILKEFEKQYGDNPIVQPTYPQIAIFNIAEGPE